MVRNMGKVDKSSTFSDNDWEEVRYKSEPRIKEWIDSQMAMRTCIVVLVGAETSNRKWVKYEIEKAMELRKGIVGIRINKLEDSSGHRLSNYVKLFEPTYKSSKYVYEEIQDNLDQLIEEAIDNRWKY